ncbi:acyl carrier protein [Streptomyces sp. Wb2n-11]|uniref:acyl carrier protein n=1 Tax=Streptomyces sp. Wb2n-11 TaxID=1030533 RepID=UPI000A46AB78|nr:phosphopantetheine-binding protein [Streptomyces sp. Wb2n-11]
MTGIEEVRKILRDLGIEEELLRQDSQLRTHLGLDSVDLTQVQPALTERFDTRIDLWAEHDFTVRQLADVIGDRRPGAGACGE